MTDLLNQKFIPSLQICVLTATVRTAFGILHRGILLPAILAERDCVNLLDYKLRLLQHRLLLAQFQQSIRYSWMIPDTSPICRVTEATFSTWFSSAT